MALKYLKEKTYHAISYQGLHAITEGLAARLLRRGIKKGDAVAIMSYNRPEWAMTDLALLKLGAVVVPIYYMPGHFLPAASVRFILNDSKAKMIFVENKELLALIDAIRPEIPLVQNVAVFEPPAGSDDPGTIPFPILASPGPRFEAPAPVSADDLATIVYTSGTTGEPKGVMLTHANIVSNVTIAVRKFKFTPDDVVISYLPIGHMFERTCGYYSVLSAGGSIGYARDLTTVARDAEAIRPTILLAVPRVIEKAYNTALEKIAGGSSLKRWLVAAAIKALNDRANRRFRKQKINVGLKLKCAVYERLVASKFKKLGGGRIRVIVAGSAPLNRQIAKILYVLGFNIVEGYGLTETAPVVSSNTVEDNILGTVGKPFDGIEVKIGDDSEILVRGPNVMKGYYNKPEETARAIDSEGWLHTGDQGKFDERGHLVITGRLKELLVTSGGKKIAPAPIEARITFSPFIEQAVVAGDNRQFLIALVVPNREAVEKFAASSGAAGCGYAELLATDLVLDKIKDEIRRAIRDLPSYEKPKAFAVLDQNLTVENGMLTPTLKFKRQRIAENFREIIDDAYRGRPAQTASKKIIDL